MTPTERQVLDIVRELADASPGGWALRDNVAARLGADDVTPQLTALLNRGKVRNTGFEAYRPA